MTSPANAADARANDTTLPISGKVGITRTDATVIDVDTKEVTVAVDITTLADDPSIRIALSLEVSTDGGQTWTRDSTSTHAGGREARDKNGAPLRDEFGIIMREPGIEIGKDGKPLAEYSLTKFVDTVHTKGTPMFRGVVESLTTPITTTARTRKG